MIDRSASVAIATGGVLTLFISAAPNGTSILSRVVDEISGSVCEQQITSDLHAATAPVAPPRLPT